MQFGMQLVRMGLNSDAEYITYDNERQIILNKSPIEWRSRNQNKYLEIPQIVWKYLCIAVTSTSPERMFLADTE